MRTLIIIAALLALTACRSHQQTSVSHVADSVAIATYKLETNIRDSLLISSCLQIDSAEIIITRPDSVCMTIRAKGISSNLTKQNITDSRLSEVQSDSICVKTDTSTFSKPAKPQRLGIVNATVILIILISLIYLIARLCKH